MSTFIDLASAAARGWGDQPVSWEDLKRFYLTPSKYSEHPVVVRLLSAPVRYIKHFRFHRRNGEEPREESCPRFAFTVLDMSDGQPKVMDVGPSIVRKISVFLRDEEFPVDSTDFIIRREDLVGFPSYDVTPVRGREVTENERLRSTNFIGREDLEELLSDDGQVHAVLRRAFERSREDTSQMMLNLHAAGGVSDADLLRAFDITDQDSFIPCAGKDPGQVMEEAMNEAVFRAVASVRAEDWTGFDFSAFISPVE